MPPGAPQAGPREAKTIDFSLVFDGFRKQVLFRGNGDPKKGTGLTRRCEDVFLRNRKMRVSPTSLFLSNWDPQNLQYF